MTFTIEPNGANVHVVRFDVPDAEWEQWVRLSGDEHFDSAYCDRDLLKEHLEIAKRRNAMHIMVGDWYDAMQGKYDPRRDYDDLRDEYKGTNYSDLLVDDAANFLEPYAENIGIMAKGNHETEFERRRGTDLITRLSQRLRDAGSNVHVGGYTGYVIFRFTINGTNRRKRVLKYHHGMGGNAPVTRGVIASNRMAVMFPDADFILSGHNHESWIVPIQQEKLSRTGRVVMRPQWHIRTPSYKQAWGDSKNVGFDVEKGSPKPRGCVWLRFYVHDKDIQFELTQAVV